MKNIYKIPKSQLIVIIIFGVIVEFFTLLSMSDSYYDESTYGFWVIVIPFLVIFYCVGWRHYNKGISEYKSKDIDSKTCNNCKQKNLPNSKYCLSCGKELINN